MKSNLPTLVLIVLVLFAVSCAQAPEEPAVDPAQEAADIEAIKSLDDGWMAALNAADTSATVAVFADDAMWLVADAPSVVGKEALRAQQQKTFDEYDMKINWSHEEIHVGGEWAWSRGPYELTQTPKAGGEAVNEKGKFLTIYKRQPDGSWKVYRDIGNRDHPSGTPQ